MALEIVDDLGGLGGDAFTVRAGVDISGGMWARTTSGSWSQAIASTGTVAAFDSDQVTVTSVTASGTNRPIGLALQDQTSGTDSHVAVARKGTVVLAANAGVTAGELVASSNAGAAEALIADTAAYNDVVGQSYNACGSGEHAIVELTL